MGRKSAHYGYALILALLIGSVGIAWAGFQTDVIKATVKVQTPILQSTTGNDTSTIPDIADAVTKKHSRGHSLGSASDQTDVDTTGITNGQGLKWDTATSKWIPATFTAGGVTGNGTAGKMTMWTGTSTIGDATDNDTAVHKVITLQHTQGTDQGLDTGGLNAVTVVNVRDAVIKKHAHTGTENYVPKWNGSTYVDGTMFDSGGNVGIGTITPITKFEVYGTGALSTARIWVGIPSATLLSAGAVPRITIGRADAAGSGVMEFVSNTTLINANVGLLSFGNYNIADAEKRIAILDCETETDTGSGRLQFWTRNYTGTFGVRMVINKTGNVGIGTTTPPSRLTVKLSDAVGADSFVIQDSTGMNVAGIDSDGNEKLVGKITTYNNIATVSNGIPSELATVDTTNVASNITGTTLYVPVASGMFRLSIVLQVKTAATTSSVLGGATGVRIYFDEPDGSVSQVIKPLLTGQDGAVIVPATGNVGNATTTQSQGSCVIYAKAGVGILYNIGYTSVGVTAMTYNVHLKLEAL